MTYSNVLSVNIYFQVWVAHLTRRDKEDNFKTFPEKKHDVVVSLIVVQIDVDTIVNGPCHTF